MKLILTSIITLLLVSCNKTKEDVASINKEYASVKAEVDSYNNQARILNESIETLQKKNDHLSQLSNGKKPLYILLLNVHQSNFTLDITQHIKNSMNSSEFEIPVSEDYYNQVTVGNDLSDSFKMGSFIMTGSWGDIKVTVKNKEIKYQ